MSFNPLPSPKQGETERRGFEATSRLAVSIRSPHRSKGRRPLTALKSRRACSSFNPLPSPKQGETDNPDLQTGGRLSFNPLPSPKQGETAAVCGLHDLRISCFNPLPSPKQGETASTDHADLANLHASIRFNPLPSPKQGETVACLRYGATRLEFQSAPLTEARGDKAVRSTRRSLPETFARFQSAPLTEARGDRYLRSALNCAFGI